MTVCSCNLTYVFQSESTLYSCLNVKELFAWRKRKIWSLSEYNWTRNQKHLVCKQTLNHLAIWLSVCLRTKWFWVRVQLQLQTKFHLVYKQTRNHLVKWLSVCLRTKWDWVRVQLQPLFCICFTFYVGCGLLRPHTTQLTRLQKNVD